MASDRFLENVGMVRAMSGDITTLNAIGGPRPPAAIETMLGFRPGRLARGYYLLLLIERLRPDDFEFAGTTLRSAGREGLPAATQAADGARAHVSDQMRQQYGEQHYLEMKKQFAGKAQIVGPQRIAKIFPVEGINFSFSPRDEYPMGGGGLQWTIRKETPKDFLIAMHVTPRLMATIPGFSVSLASNLSPMLLLENRTQIAKYLATAKRPEQQ